MAKVIGINYSVVRKHNKPSELVERLQGLSEESVTLPLSGTHDKFKARLRDWLRFLCIKGDRHLNKDNTPYLQSSALADNKPIDSETTRHPQLASSQANTLNSSLLDEVELRTEFKSIR